MEKKEISKAHFIFLALLLSVIALMIIAFILTQIPI